VLWTRPAPGEEPSVDPGERPDETPTIEPGRVGEPGIDYPGVEPGVPGVEPGVEPTDPDEI
jgi:hypothetical protein